MDVREVCTSDLLNCLGIEPRVWGDALVGRDAALRVWRQWADSLAFQSAVIEMPAAHGCLRAAAFGASVFVTPEFATRELRDPRPGLNSRIFAAEVAGHPVVRSEPSLSGGSALDVVILACNCRYAALTPAEASEAEVLLTAAFAEAHLGYRLGRILIETVSERQRRLHLSSGVWRTVKAFPPAGSHLLLLSGKEALAVSGSIAAPLFQYQPPVLGLRDADKQLLAAAIHGDTDAELAVRLHLTLAAVKKRWAALFDRVAGVRPDLLPEARNGTESDARGPQKRHRILAYVRSHPQEVRPFRWSRQAPTPEITGIY